MSEPIKSFVFFDTETTGLRGCDPPKITELAFVACTREHLLSSGENCKDEIPRVIFKLLLPFNPMKMIHPVSTRITRLDNFLLENCKKMDKNTIDMMTCFLNQLSKPICLVAHNGNKFDYPILKWQLKQLNCRLDNDLLCVDSLEIFKEIDKDAIESSSAIDEFLNTNLRAVQSLNEKTQSKKPIENISKIGSEKPNAARCLFPSKPYSRYDTQCTSTSNTPTNSNGNKPTTQAKSFPIISYKLTEIYKRLLGHEPADAHTAEADTMFILKCAIATKGKFVENADSMATNFNDTQFK